MGDRFYGLDGFMNARSLNHTLARHQSNAARDLASEAVEAPPWAAAHERDKSAAPSGDTTPIPMRLICRLNRSGSHVE